MKSQLPPSQSSLGRILTAREVAAIFRLDVRTVRRYYTAFGGVRIGHALRFLENRILEIFNGNLHEQEEGLPQALERTGLVSGQNGSGKMVWQQQGRREECHSVGSNHQEATGGRSRDCAGKSDPFGLRAPTGDDS